MSSAERRRLPQALICAKPTSAVEIQPGNRAVVHHVLMFAGDRDDIGEHFRGGAAGYDGIVVPGQRVKPYPAGMARRIKAGSKLVFQVHYTPNGTEQFDQSRVGMLFVDPNDVEYEVRTASAVNSELHIPPGEPNYRVEAASPRIPAGARLLSLTAHMHCAANRSQSKPCSPAASGVCSSKSLATTSTGKPHTA